MRIFHRFTLLFALLLIASPSFAGRYVDLVDPAPVVVPANVDSTQVTKNIKRALAGHGWVLSQERPGRTEATLRLREHLAGIDVEFHAQRVSIAHADSAELDFEETKSCRAIHRTSNRRVANVAGDVHTTRQLSAEGG